MLAGTVVICTRTMPVGSLPTWFSHMVMGRWPEVLRGCWKTDSFRQHVELLECPNNRTQSPHRAAETSAQELGHVCLFCDPAGCSPLDFSAQGILWARILECHSLFKGIFLTQGLKLSFLSLLHCRWILYSWATREAPGNAKERTKKSRKKKQQKKTNKQNNRLTGISTFKVRSDIDIPSTYV